jgi:hypothetical protein
MARCAVNNLYPRVQEESYRYVVLECDPTLTPWSRLCIEQVWGTRSPPLAPTSFRILHTRPYCGTRFRALNRAFFWF